MTAVEKGDRNETDRVASFESISSNLICCCDCCRSFIDALYIPVGLDGSWFVGQAYCCGHIITYDGSVYEFNGVGEYLLTRIKTTRTEEEISVNIMQVSDVTMFSYINKIRG